jgi:protein TonB
MTRRRPPDAPSRRYLALSAALHVSAVALAWTTTVIQPEPLQYITYEIELVSPPPAPAEEIPEEVPAPEEELVVERPEPEPEPEVEEELAVPDPEVTEATPVEEPQDDPPPDPAAAAAAAAAVAAEAEETPEETGEGINVRMEGLRRDYPAYYDNVIRQMSRCFRWRETGDFEAVVRFVVNRDGTVSDARLVQRSGNPEFDFEALGAVECAGRPGRLGPLPEDLPWEELPIQFSFRPQGR